MFIEICSCTLYNLLFGCNQCWEDCREYLLYMIYYATVTILIYLHPQYFLNTSLLDFTNLVDICIETHILIPNLSISHIFIYIYFKICCFLLLHQLFTFNPKYSNKCNQHHHI